MITSPTFITNPMGAKPISGFEMLGAIRTVQHLVSMSSRNVIFEHPADLIILRTFRTFVRVYDYFWSTMSGIATVFLHVCQILALAGECLLAIRTCTCVMCSHVSLLVVLVRK